MIQAQIKLRIKPKQEAILMSWLIMLKCVWNWAIRKIELDAKDGIYYKKQLRQMISYKCTASGRKYVEVDSKFSTMTCSHCLARTGPTGKAGLSVRQWECTECRTSHDRDQNAAINTLIAGLGRSLERVA